MSALVQQLKATIRNKEIVLFQTNNQKHPLIRIYDAREHPGRPFVNNAILCQVLIEFRGEYPVWVNIGSQNRIVYTDKKEEIKNTDPYSVYEYTDQAENKCLVGRRYITSGDTEDTNKTICIATGDDKKTKLFIDSSAEAVRAWLMRQHRENPRIYPRPNDSVIRMLTDNYEMQLRLNLLYPFPAELIQST